jgi:hypothetical protein
VRKGCVGARPIRGPRANPENGERSSLKSSVVPARRLHRLFIRSDVRGHSGKGLGGNSDRKAFLRQSGGRTVPFRPATAVPNQVVRWQLDAASAQSSLREASEPVGAAAPAPADASSTRSQRHREKRNQLPRKGDLCLCDEMAWASQVAFAKRLAKEAACGMPPLYGPWPAAALPRTTSVRGGELCLECGRWVDHGWGRPMTTSVSSRGQLGRVRRACAPAEPLSFGGDDEPTYDVDADIAFGGADDDVDF